MTLKFRRVIVSILLIFILALCVALPTIETIARDLRNINSINVVEMEPIRLDNDDRVSLPKRISLISSKIYNGEYQNFGLDSGSKFKLNTAIENAMAQIDLLYNKGLLPEGSDAYMQSDDKLQQIFIGGIEFAVDNDDPSCNIILWDIEAISEKYSISIKMDDETGKILMYKVRSEDLLEWTDNLSFSDLSNLWSEYLELSVRDNSNVLLDSKAKIYLDMNSNLYSFSGSYDFSNIEDDTHRVLHMNLYNESAEVEYIIYNDSYEFGIVVE